MSNLDTMRKLVATCPWLKAGNLLAAANANPAWSDAVTKCWKALMADGDVDALEAAVGAWEDVGVSLQSDFINKVYNDPDLNPR